MYSRVTAQQNERFEESKGTSMTRWKEERKKGCRNDGENSSETHERRSRPSTRIEKKRPRRQSRSAFLGGTIRQESRMEIDLQFNPHPFRGKMIFSSPPSSRPNLPFERGAIISSYDVSDEGWEPSGGTRDSSELRFHRSDYLLLSILLSPFSVPTFLRLPFTTAILFKSFLPLNAIPESLEPTDSKQKPFY